MTYCSEGSAPKKEDFSTQILGETGGTVVYVFTNGNARVKKGKKVRLETDLADSGDRPASSTDRTPPKAAPRRSPSTSAIQPPPPPPLTSKPTNQQTVPRPSASCKPSPLSPSSPTATPKPAMPRAATPRAATAPKASPMPKTSLVEYLLAKKLINPVQLEVAQYDANTSGLSMGDVLLARGWVTQEAIAKFSEAVPSPW